MHSVIISSFFSFFLKNGDKKETPSCILHKTQIDLPTEVFYVSTPPCFFCSVHVLVHNYLRTKSHAAFGKLPKPVFFY